MIITLSYKLNSAVNRFGLELQTIKNITFSQHMVPKIEFKLNKSLIELTDDFIYTTETVSYPQRIL